MKYSAALIASVAVAQAAPVDQVCKVVTSVVYGQPTWVPDNAAAAWTPVPQSPAAQTSTWATWTGKSPDADKKTTTSEWASWTSKVPDADKTKTTTSDWATWTDPSTPKPTSKTTTDDAWASWTTTGAAVTTSKPWDHHTTTAAPTTTKGPWPTTTKATTTTTTSQPAPTCAVGTQSKTTVVWAGYYWDLYCGWGVDQTTVQSMRTAGTLKFWEATPKVQYDSPADCEALCAKDSTCGSVVYTNDPSANPNDYKRCWLTDNLPRPNSATYGQISYKLRAA